MPSDAGSSTVGSRRVPLPPGAAPDDPWGRILPAAEAVDWTPWGWPCFEWGRVAVLTIVFGAVVAGGVFLATGTLRFVATVLADGYVLLLAPAVALLAETLLVPWQIGLTEHGVTFRYASGGLVVPWTLVVPETIGRHRRPALCFVHPEYGRTYTVRLPKITVRALLENPHAAEWVRYRGAAGVWGTHSTASRS